MEGEKKKVISVLLTRYHSTFSDFIYYVTGKGYTHASLALDVQNEYYYSFNFKGFRKEYPKKHRRKSDKSVSYQLEISEEGYQKIVKRIEKMEEIKEEYHYSRLGVFLCLFHIPFKFKRHYFCSQFVMELLQITGEIFPQKNISLYFPNEMPELLEKQGCLYQIVCNPL